jgi:hypothetical protein
MCTIDIPEKKESKSVLNAYIMTGDQITVFIKVT